LSEVIVIVLIGDPVGVLAALELVVAELVALALLALLLDELEPHAESKSAKPRPAVASTASHSRRVDGAPLLSGPCMNDLLMGV
jgi:hypothetical protein